MMIKIYSIILCIFLILRVSAEKKPNFLFIIVDDQSPLDLKIYNPRSILDTPNIDRSGRRREWSWMVPIIWEPGWEESVPLPVIW